MIIIIELPITESENSRILDLTKVPKPQIREKLNKRKLPDLQYIKFGTKIIPWIIQT